MKKINNFSTGTDKEYCSGAGAETTAISLTWWTLAMIAFPKVQRRAQVEIDAVVGRDRLPTFADSPHLPHVRAIISEFPRWRPATPFSVPHVATGEDWYEGMYIQKGTVCISNVWHCNHDRTVFGEDANEFRPERHLNEHRRILLGPKETYQAGHVTFRFGRHICAARDLANESLFINTGRILWAAKLERAREWKASSTGLGNYR